MEIKLVVHSHTEGVKTLILPICKATWEVDEFGPVDIIIEGPIDTVLLLDYYIGGNAVYDHCAKRYKILIARMEFKVIK